jgi:KDO2-lipid IV(A) lauroyltransferase
VAQNADNARMSLIRHGLTHLALLPARLLGHLPLDAGRALMRLGSPLIERLMGRRRRVVDRNLALCFPDWPEARRRAVRRGHFVQLSEAVAETAFCWCRRRPLDHEQGSVVGLEHLEAARETGQGVLLVTGHTTCLELGARLFAEQVEARGVYRPLRNPVLDRFQNRGRARYGPGMIPRDQLKSMVRYLRAGEVVWYAPDQDFGPERSEFVSFFGLATATTRGMLDLARLGRARVVPMYPLKDPVSGRVTVKVFPALPGVPSEDPVSDLRQYNRFLEEQILEAPAQYWWLHRRFKSAPAGEPDRYIDQSRSR